MKKLEDMTDSEIENKAIDALNKFRNSKKAYSEFSKTFDNNYLIIGKTLKEWKEYFNINIPPDAGPVRLQEIGARLSGLYHEASLLKAGSEIKARILKSNSEAIIREKLALLITEHKEKGWKIPARDILNSLAQESAEDEFDTCIHSEIAVMFWKTIIDDLKYSKSIIENATTNIAVESKALQNERFIDSINRRNN